MFLTQRAHCVAQAQVRMYYLEDGGSSPDAGSTTSEKRNEIPIAGLDSDVLLAGNPAPTSQPGPLPKEAEFVPSHLGSATDLWEENTLTEDTPRNSAVKVRLHALGASAHDSIYHKVSYTLVHPESTRDKGLYLGKRSNRE